MQIKLIIWDLDDTLWHGTLADGDTVRLMENRAQMIRDFNARGVVHSICSKNDRAAATAKLEELGLWDQFVFAHIDFTPKAEAVAGIIEAMQLRPANVLFVDDNALNLQGVKHRLPNIHILDALADDCDAILEALLAAQPAGGKSRVEQYRQLEAKATDRAAAAGSNEDFLRQCGIQACAAFNMDNLDFVERIAELVNRSNQLNYTSSRVEPQALAEAIMDVVAHDSWALFAWDRYGDYGLIGFVQVDRKAKRLKHFAFSCRIMHMGLEQYALSKVLRNWPDCDLTALSGRTGPGPFDWIAEARFHDAEIRDRLIAQLNPKAQGTRDIRIMYDCQSGGIAHFSRKRDSLEFDNNPRLFALRHMITGAMDEAFAPTLVYGAGVDYSNPRWPDLDDLLEGEGLFEGCVQLMCERVVNDGAKMLVILPPEDAPEGHYRPHIGHTRARTMMFNAIWRTAASFHETIEIFELTGFVQPDDAPDVSHFYAGFLQKLAGVVDDWLDGKRLPVVRAA